MKSSCGLTINFIAPVTSLAGGTKSNRLIAEAMVRRGHKVNIAFVALPRRWPKPRQMKQWIRRLGDEIATLGRKHHHLDHSIASLIPVKKRRIEKDDVPDADVTIATWWETREWIDKWPDRKGVKCYFVRGHELYGGDPGRVKRTYRMPGPKFVISTWLQNIMATEYGDRDAVLVPNGVDREQFDSCARGRQPVPTVGLLYGRQEHKGARTAFDCLRRVRERIPSLRALAFGSAPILRAHAAPSWLEYYLRPRQSEIGEIYRQADCWIVPSTIEGFGMPGLEAAACHCPIVSTRCGGPEDYVEDGRSGYLVPVGDSSAMADAVGRVLTLNDSQWSAMSEASYEISRRFDWDRSAAILESALLDEIKGREKHS